MTIAALEKKLQQKFEETNQRGFRKSLNQIISLLNELYNKEIAENDSERLLIELEQCLSTINTEEQAKKSLKQLKKILTKQFNFTAANHYTALGIGIGLVLGTAIGVSLGAPFNMPYGLIFGLTIGSGFGLITGLAIGRALDAKSEEKNKVLKSL